MPILQQRATIETLKIFIMRKTISNILSFMLSTVLLLILFSSCSNKTIPALTAAQKTTIEEEVKAQHDVFVSAITRNNYEDWVDCYSKDNFISAFAYPVVDGYDYDKWIREVKGGFSQRIKHKTDLLDITVTPLSPDLAVSTQFGTWQNWWKDSPYAKTIFHASFLWKKEIDGWKIIHVNETGFPNLD